MISTIILIAFFVFILWDTLIGLRRGIYPALCRLAMIFVCAIAAFFCAQYLGNHILEISFNGETLKEMFDGILHGNKALESALAYSETVEQLVWHLPEVLAKEVLFVPIFLFWRLITIPLMIPTKKIIKKFRKEKAAQDAAFEKINAEYYENTASAEEADDEDAEEAQPAVESLPPVTEKKSFFSRHKNGLIGGAIGFVEGLVCFAILMVPVFGISSIGANAIDTFGNTDIREMRELCETVNEYVVEPVENSGVTKVMSAVGVRSVCMSIFHSLSNTTLNYKNTEDKDIFYFDTLEAAYPAVSAFLLLQDMDPEHMTTDDFKKLNTVFTTAKQSEEVAAVLQDVTNGIVETYVDDKYRGSAEVVTSQFVDYIMDVNTDTESIDLEMELEAVQNILTVMNSATTEGAETAFAEKNVDTVVDGLLDTEASYETVISITKDEEKSAVLREEISMGNLTKEQTKDELLKYRSEKLASVSPDKADRVNELVDSVAALLNIDLNS